MTHEMEPPINQVMDTHAKELVKIKIQEMTNLFSPLDNVTLIFDGPNFFGTVKSLGLGKVQYDKLFAWFRELANLQSIYYFTAVSDDPHHTKLKGILDWMVEHGVRVRTTESTKDLYLGDAGNWSGNMDVEIACAALTECTMSNHIVLATGDSDFVPVVETLQRMGKKVTILSSRSGEPCVLSMKLRRAADGFIDIDNLPDTIFG